MRLPALDQIPADVDRWDAHRLLEAALHGLRTAEVDGFQGDYEESREEVLRLILEIEDQHPELRPQDWREPWGSADRRT